ncbi:MULTISPECIES: hypothetical protein [Brevibacterium]|nr:MULTISPECIES: hypothetical protein [Brevibacterium]
MESTDRLHGSKVMLRRRAIMGGALVGGFAAQALYSLAFAALLEVPADSRWPPVVAAGVMVVVVAVATWGRERRIRRVAWSAVLAAVVFILSYALLGEIGDAVAEQVPMRVSGALERIHYFFGLTGEAWTSFIISMVVAALVTAPRRA